MLYDNTQSQLEPSTQLLNQSPLNSASFGLALLGTSSAVNRLKRQVAKTAPTGANLLIRGEEATGKQAVGLAVHNQSTRRSAKFVTLYCNSLDAADLACGLANEHLAAQAHPDSKEVLARAQGGTLFLQDVCDLPMEAQDRLQKLLRADALVVPGTRHRLDARIIASTTEDPLQAIETGRLSANLYYQLAELQLETPPLRLRLEDVPTLAQSLLSYHSGPRRCFDANALEVLVQHTFPGNLRELKNIVAHAALYGGRKLTAADLPALNLQSCAHSSGVVVGESIAQVERRLIMATLEFHDWDKQKSAKTLGISVKTLYNRLRSYDRPGIG